jgi:hypothetical protein
MNPTLRKCLDDLEARIDPQQEERLLQQWVDFSKGRFQGDVFSPTRPSPAPPRVEWPRASVNAALVDYEAMALQQYGACSQQLTDGSGAVMNVRCNYGTSIIPLLYGVEPFLMDEELDTLPTSRPLNDVDAIRRIVDAGVPELRGGYTERVFEMVNRYTKIARDYPKVGRYVHIYHPDLQGPMDICEVVWGSTIFYAMYDRPELVHALLEIVTQTYVRFMRAWTEVVPFEAHGNAHWGYFHQGNIMLRDDSAMNLSPDMFDAFVQPYDQRLLDAFGGGAIHFCGKGDHYIDRLPQMRGVYAVHMSQPQYNDMEKMLTYTADAGINLLGLEPDAARAVVAGGRKLRGRVHSYVN